MLPNIIYDCSCIQEFSTVARTKNTLIGWNFKYLHLKTTCLLLLFLGKIVNNLTIFKVLCFIFVFQNGCHRSKTFNMGPCGIRKKRSVQEGIHVLPYFLDYLSLSLCGLYVIVVSIFLMVQSNSPLNSPHHGIYINHWFLIYLH